MNAKEAREFLPNYIHQLKQSKIPEFNKLLTTLKKLHEKLFKALIESYEMLGEVIRLPY